MEDAAQDYRSAASLMDAAARELAGMREPARTKILDLGTGTGNLVRELLALGYDAYGCDRTAFWHDGDTASEKLSAISIDPYRLPYEDATFEIVVSTSVLEHAQNKEEIFLEIKRVLKPGGYAIHLYPGKWYLPFEPHIYVPLVNVFWPRCPRWWFALWALLGVRNEFQKEKSWKEVVEANVEYCAHGLSYWPDRDYRELSMKIFGNYAFPMDFFIRHGYGGVQRLLKRLPFARFTGAVARRIRMSLIVQRKTAGAEPSRP